MRYRVRLYTSAFVDVYVDAVDEEAAAVAARTEASEIDDEFHVELPARDVTVELETGDWEFMEAEAV